MKLFFSTLTFLLLFSFSCKKDTQALKPLEVPTQLLDLIPEAYDSASVAIFRDIDGNEKVLHFFNKEVELAEYKVGGLDYTTTNTSYVLVDSMETSYYIYLFLSNRYHLEQNTNKTVSQAFFSIKLITNAYSPEIVIGEDLNIFGTNRNFYPEYVFNGKRFEDVYGDEVLNTNSYSLICYSKHVGVVAFKDIDNRLWVFDRFA